MTYKSIGALPTSRNMATFATPVFEEARSQLRVIQVIGSEETILDFQKVEITRLDLIEMPATDVKINGQAQYCFRNHEGKTEVGSRASLATKLSSSNVSREDDPYLALTIAQFLGDDRSIKLQTLKIENRQNELRANHHTKESDSMGNVDIYLDYGRYPQAIELLEQLTTRDQTELDAWLKLLGLCLTSNQSERYELTLARFVKVCQDRNMIHSAFNRILLMDREENYFPKNKPSKEDDFNSDEINFGVLDDDASQTKLHLARAYIAMGDEDGARDILKEVLDEGGVESEREARSVLDELEENSRQR